VKSDLKTIQKQMASTKVNHSIKGSKQNLAETLW